MKTKSNNKSAADFRYSNALFGEQDSSSKRELVQKAGEIDLTPTQLKDLPVLEPVITSNFSRRSRKTNSYRHETRIELAQGDVLADRYEIIRRLGDGGMGVVYAAKDRLREEEVALKVMREHLISDPQARERFVNEARVASSLSHPRIVRVYDIHQTSKHTFLTMELLKGCTLRQELKNRAERKQRFAVTEVKQWGIQLCQALSHAHELTIHRDIKPENIWICDDGTLKVMDFGIARLMRPSQFASTGLALGTAYYMAPEQVRAQKDIDHRADQYSTGVVLYELLTGQIPQGAVGSPKELRRNIPSNLSNAVMICLSGNAKDRHANMKCLELLLAKDKSIGGRKKSLFVFGLLMILLVVGSMWWFPPMKQLAARFMPALLGSDNENTNQVVGLSSESPIRWNRFRGPNGNGKDPTANIPKHWSDTDNVQWKAKLPGPGASSPIIWDNKVFVTCYSDYGIYTENPGQMNDLRYHLLCFDRNSGDRLWKATVRSNSDVLPFNGTITNHGYASNTPTTDGKHVYAYFGTSGLYAFDMSGKQVWTKSAGNENGSFGSASSPILFENHVIVNASNESGAVIGFDKYTGQEKWRVTTTQNYTTPIIVPGNGKDELVVATFGKVMGIDPINGDYLWYVNQPGAYRCSSPIEHNGRVLVATSGIEGGGTLAINPGGRGDVSKTHAELICEKASSYLSTPIVSDQTMLLFKRGILTGINTNTGAEVVKKRLEVKSETNGNTFTRYGNQRSSMILAGNNVLIVTSVGATIVLDAASLEQLATNFLKEDKPMFNGTPAICENQLFIRSNQYLYCIAE